MTQSKIVKAIDFGKFKSATPEMNMSELPAGWNLVTINRIVPITDRYNSLTETTKKDKTYEWDDETPQVAIIFVSETGTIIHRFNLAGFVRFEELDESLQKTHLSAGDYAVDMKSKKRIISQKRTNDCQNILNNLFFACKRKDTNGDWETLPEGSGFADIQGCTLEVKVEESSYDGKPQKRTIQYRKFSEQIEKVPDDF